MCVCYVRVYVYVCVYIRVYTCGCMCVYVWRVAQVYAETQGWRGGCVNSVVCVSLYMLCMCVRMTCSTVDAERQGRSG